MLNLETELMDFSGHGQLWDGGVDQVILIISITK